MQRIEENKRKREEHKRERLKVMTTEEYVKEFKFRKCYKDNELYELYEFLSSARKNDRRITRSKVSTLRRC